MRRTWNLINGILKPRAKKSSVSVTEIVCGGAHLVESADIADAFNRFFSGIIGSSIADSLPTSDCNYTKYLSGNCTSSFYFSPVLPEDVERVVSTLRNKQGGINNLPTNVLKHIICTISPALAAIVNRSLESGVFPDSQKIARVVPLFKDGDRSDINNYRPISVLTAYSQLDSYLSTQGILIEQQFGFRTGRTTTNATVDLLLHVYDYLDRGRVVFSLFLDFRKAFDCVDQAATLWHSRCLSRMVSIISWE